MASTGRRTFTDLLLESGLATEKQVADAMRQLEDRKKLGESGLTLEDILEECGPYLGQIYPDIRDMEALITELFLRDIEMGTIRETGPGVYGHRPGNPDGFV